MPLPKRLSAPFRRSSYTTPTSQFSTPSKPRSRPRSYWVCHPHRASFLSSRSNQHHQKPHHAYSSTNPDPPIRPHYFDTYTGTWSPRKVPSTPQPRHSGLWSPRQIASRIATPAKRPTSPTSPTTATTSPIISVSAAKSATTTTTTPGTEHPNPLPDPEPDSHPMHHQLRHRNHPLQPRFISERPPSRGKGGASPPFTPTTDTIAGGTNAPPQRSQSWSRIAEEESEDEDPLSPAHETAAAAAARPADGRDRTPAFTVTKVALPAREDVRPQSRDWADPVGGWGVIDGVAGEGERRINGGGRGVGMKGGVVFLPPVVHEMSVLPVVDRVA